MFWVKILLPFGETLFLQNQDKCIEMCLVPEFSLVFHAIFQDVYCQFLKTSIGAICDCIFVRE